MQWIWISMMMINTSLAYIKVETPPKFCNPWGATNVCEQVNIREKENAIWHVIFTQQVKENMMAKISKWLLETTYGHLKEHPPFTCRDKQYN